VAVVQEVAAAQADQAWSLLVIQDLHKKPQVAQSQMTVQTQSTHFYLQELSLSLMQQVELLPMTRQTLLLFTPLLLPEHSLHTKRLMLTT
jgi:hypothetical protein